MRLLTGGSRRLKPKVLRGIAPSEWRSRLVRLSIPNQSLHGMRSACLDSPDDHAGMKINECHARDFHAFGGPYEVGPSKFSPEPRGNDDQRVPGPAVPGGKGIARDRASWIPATSTRE